MTQRGLELIARAQLHDTRTAILAGGRIYTYRDLLAASAHVAATLLQRSASPDLEERRVAFLVPPGFDYVAVQWGIWRAGGIAVPLALSHPLPELEYVVRDADAFIIIAHPEFAERAATLASVTDVPVLDTTECMTALPDRQELAAARTTVTASGGAGAPTLPLVEMGRRAMILYTSGTTSRPKGVVSTHDNIRAQVRALVDAWEWQRTDHILCLLPLHHLHGILNVVTCALWAGAQVTMLPRFDAAATWDAIEIADLTLFMAVPTIYGRLIESWETFDSARQARLSAACRHMRLMVSGSAALPVHVLEKWQTISGHVLLERYGMTEIGMALSNPLHGERRPGFVGTPLTGVQVRLVDESGAAVPAGTPGEIEVRGPAVFHEYWHRPAETRASFRDGWFRTGDVATIERGAYRILGRNSVDIIKTGGYKVSALEIEEVLRTHDAVLECAVVGVQDADRGERVCAAIVPSTGTTLDPLQLREWAKQQLAPYKVPGIVLLVEDLPRNAMGKVLKPEVARLFNTNPTPASASRPTP